MPKRTNNTLLIVDDEPDVCLLLKRALSTQYAQIDCAYSLAEGMEMAARLSPDLIVLDNNLPDGYGIHQIRSFKDTAKSARVVMISAMDVEEDAMAAGADDFLEKPVSLSRLRSVT
ncbi:MAG: response regulator [Saprospiraceae bacterium]|nr:response regulator [Saprospiraceae bacterium]